MENLNLGHTKPLAFLKIQTTGMDSKKDRIIEVSITRVETDGKSKTGTRLINPEMPIPAEVTALNGITDDMVKDQPKFKELAANLSKFMEGCDFAGFNIENFDLKFLAHEFSRAGIEFNIMGKTIVDISKIYNAMEPRDFRSACRFYCGTNMPEQIRSEEATTMYVSILNNMFEKYKGQTHSDKFKKPHTIESTVESIQKIFNSNTMKFDAAGVIVPNEQGRPVFAFGTHKGKIVSEHFMSDERYYDWFINASGYPLDTISIAKKILEKAKSAALTK